MRDLGYGDFGDSEGLEDENDDDIGALGSILSWENDDDEGSGAVSGSLAAISASLRGRESTGGTSSVPPDTVQFNSKDGQFNFFSNGSVMSGSSSSNNLLGGLTLQLPMPTPVGDLSQKASAPGTQTPTNFAGATLGLQAAIQAQLQQHQNAAAKQSSTEDAASNVAQNAGQAQPVQKAAQPTDPATSTPVQIPKIQMPFTSDPNAFLQQLQIAQLQHQLQAAQQQALQSQQQVPQVVAALQQLQYAQNQAAQGALAQQQSKTGQAKGATPAVTQGQIPFIQAAAPFQVPIAAGMQQGVAKAKPPPAKRAKTGLKDTKPPATSTPASVPIPAGIVSASEAEDAQQFAAGSRVPTLAKRPRAEPIDTSNMTAEEKAKANRDRNREHARNTRMRKKAYLEELKSTVDELCRERDTLVSERAGAANLLVEMHNTRTEVLMAFFALRSTDEKRRSLWSSILDESCFTCSAPVTPYRSFPASEVQASKCQRTIQGIDGMMADTASLHVLFDSLVDRKRYPHGKIDFRYTLVTEEAVVAGNQMMARWVMTTTNAVQFGAKIDVTKQGMLCCKFNSAHKIIGLELMFDVMAFMLQLKHTVGSDSFSVVPNTVQTCQRTFESPMMMILSEPPYTIVQVNKAWETMTDFSAEEVVGKVGMSALNSNETDEKRTEDLMQEIRFKRAASACLVQKKKNDERFEQFFILYPLSTDSRITHFVAITEVYAKELKQGETPETPELSATVTVAPVTGSIPLKTPKPSTKEALKAPALMNPHLFASLQQNHASSLQQASSSMPPPASGLPAQLTKT